MLVADRVTQRADSRSPEAGRVALTFFFNLMERWNCSPKEQRVLLGGIGTTTYHKYRKLPAVRLPQDTLERISYLMGIHKALRLLFSNCPERACEWVRRTNALAPFNGQTPLEVMLVGRVIDLADVRRFLDAWRG